MGIKKNSFTNQITALLFFTAFALNFSSCKKDNLEETTLEDPQTEELIATDSVKSDTSSAESPAGTAATPAAAAAQPAATSTQTTAAAQQQSQPAASQTQTQPTTNVNQTQAVASAGITSGSYYLVNSLPSGYVKDGSKDYTSYIQAAVSKYSNIVFPGFPLLVNDNGINIGSNKTITFQSGSEIRLKASSKGTYAILRISNASNVTLYNPVIVGDRNTHTGSGGEWGMGIGMYGAKNVKIYSPNVSNCWGDGIYVGQLNSSINCKDIVIKDAYLKKNRRDGISIISVDGLLLDNIYAGYTDGTLPMTGINIETNNTACIVKNVRINNPRTENNGANGILINLRTMLGSTSQTSDVIITNHQDTGSPRYAFKLSAKESGYAGKLNGYVNIVNPTWKKTSLETGMPIWLGSDHPDFKINISSPEWTTTGGSVLSWANTYSLLMKYVSTAKLSVTN